MDLVLFVRRVDGVVMACVRSLTPPEARWATSLREVEERFAHPLIRCKNFVPYFYIAILL